MREESEMEKLNRENKVRCPECGKAILTPIKVGEDKTVTYLCVGGCGSRFDPHYQPDFEHKRVLFYLMVRNPKFITDLGEAVWTAASLEETLRVAVSSVQYLTPVPR